MFFFVYLRRELRQRLRRTVVTATGLAVGIGLVVTVTAATSGVRNAQAAALHSLYGIGTDLTVIKPAPTAGNRSAPGGGMASARGDLVSVGQLGLLRSESVSEISHLRGVRATAGALTLSDTQLPAQGGLPVTFTINGVELACLGLGPFASARRLSGRTFTVEDHDNVAILDAGFARSRGLRVGSRITIASTSFAVIGIVSQPPGGGATDAYIPLDRAQALMRERGARNLAGKVDVIYVRAASAPDIPVVAKAISRLLPSAIPTTANNLASVITGSLASAATLIHDLGKWLAIAALLATFATASLLTASAVGSRVRELGTLKALGWRTRRLVSQIIGEATIIGLLGAASGIALGLAGTAVIDAAAPKLTAAVARSHTSADASAAVHLAARVTPSAVVLAVVLALAGALFAGTFGAWRASRMRPADAFAQPQ